jgi:hypothetical protein
MPETPKGTWQRAMISMGFADDMIPFMLSAIAKPPINAQPRKTKSAKTFF